jgi:hypothetical protein
METIPENIKNLGRKVQKLKDFNLYTRVKWAVQLECKGESIIVGVGGKIILPFP